MSFSSVTIVGLGAIGGSIAQDLLAQRVRVVGCDVNKASVLQAKSIGVDARTELPERIDSDVVIIATPVRSIPAVLEQLTGRTDAAITDVGSTKRMVMDAATEAGLEGLFVGSHPLAGTERAGWTGAQRGMFVGSTVFLCGKPGEVRQRIALLWQLLGARAIVVDADEHDRRMAWLSHLPQLAANALALALKSGGVNHADLGPGGRDMTRLAASDATMWLDVAATNAEALDEPLGCLIEALAELRAAIASANEPTLRELFDRSKTWRAS